MAYAEMTAVRAALRDLRTGVPPIPGGSVRHAVISRLASESARSANSGRGLRRSLSYLAAAAVLVLAIGIVIAYLHSGASAVPDPPVTRLDPPPAPGDKLVAEPADGPGAGAVSGFAPSGPVREMPIPGRIRNAGRVLKTQPAGLKPASVAVPEVRPRKCADGGVELVWSDTGQGRYRVLKSHRPDDFTNAEVVVVAGTQWTDREPSGVRITYYLVE